MGLGELPNHLVVLIFGALWKAEGDGVLSAWIEMCKSIRFSLWKDRIATTISRSRYVVIVSEQRIARDVEVKHLSTTNICRPSHCTGMKSHPQVGSRSQSFQSAGMVLFQPCFWLLSQLKGGPCCLPTQCAHWCGARHSENNPVAFMQCPWASSALFPGLSHKRVAWWCAPAASRFSCFTSRLAFYTQLCGSNKTWEQILIFGTWTHFPLQRSLTGVSEGSPDCAGFLDVTCVLYGQKQP